MPQVICPRIDCVHNRKREGELDVCYARVVKLLSTGGCGSFQHSADLRPPGERSLVFFSGAGPLCPYCRRHTERIVPGPHICDDKKQEGAQERCKCEACGNGYWVHLHEGQWWYS